MQKFFCFINRVLFDVLVDVALILAKVAHSNIKYPERYFENLQYITRSNTRIALIEAKVEMFWMSYKKSW